MAKESTFRINTERETEIIESALRSHKMRSTMSTQAEVNELLVRLNMSKIYEVDEDRA